MNIRIVLHVDENTDFNDKLNNPWNDFELKDRAALLKAYSLAKPDKKREIVQDRSLINFFLNRRNNDPGFYRFVVTELLADRIFQPEMENSSFTRLES